MFGIVKPDQGSCLYFRERKPGNRFISGRGVRVGWREEWLHLKLGQFQVRLPEQKTQELITTEEGLKWEVEADFKIVLGGGGEHEEIEERLEKATRSLPLTRDNQKIELIFFQEWTTNYCKNSIKRILGDCKFIDLISEEEEKEEGKIYRTDAVRLIRDDLEKNLAKIGLLLVEHTVVLEPLEPKGIAATEVVLDKWMKFQTIANKARLAKQEAENIESLETKELENKRKKREAEAEYEKKVHERELASKLKENERRMEIKERGQIRDKEGELRKIEEEIDSWTLETQLRKIEIDTKVNEKSLTEKERLENIERESKEHALNSSLDMEEHTSKRKRDIEEQNIKHQLEMETRKVEHKLEMLKLEKLESQELAESMELREQAETKKTELERVRGLAQAAVLREKTLAKSAAIIEMRKTIFDVLPDIVDKTNHPTAQMDKIHINFVGSVDDANQNSFLGKILNSTSALPLILPAIKEIMQLFRDFEPEVVRKPQDTQEENESGNNQVNSQLLNEFELDTQLSPPDVEQLDDQLSPVDTKADPQIENS